jgi:hypothetical protein
MITCVSLPSSSIRNCSDRPSRDQGLPEGTSQHVIHTEVTGSDVTGLLSHKHYTVSRTIFCQPFRRTPSNPILRSSVYTTSKSSLVPVSVEECDYYYMYDYDYDYDHMLWDRLEAKGGTWKKRGCLTASIGTTQPFGPRKKEETCSVRNQER